MGLVDKVIDKAGSGFGKLMDTGVDIWSNIYNNEQARKRQREANKANMRLSEYQYNREREELDYMNMYNTPENQVKRLREAGLNPALMFKTQPQNTQTQMAKYQRPEIGYAKPSYQFSGIGNTLGKWIDNDVNREKGELLREQQNQVRANTMQTIIKSDRAKFDLELQKDIREYTQNVAKYSAWKTKEEAEKLNNENAIKLVEAKLMQSGITLQDPVAFRIAMAKQFSVTYDFEKAWNSLPMKVKLQIVGHQQMYKFKRELPNINFFYGMLKGKTTGKK